MSMLLVRMKGENKRNVKIANGDSFLKRLSYWRGNCWSLWKRKKAIIFD